MNFRLFQESDLDRYLLWVNQRAIWRVDNPGPYEVRTRESFGAQWLKIVAWRRSWIIEVSGEPIGYVGFVSDDADRLTDEFFIVIGETSRWGEGHGGAAMRWLFKKAEALGLTQLTGQVLGNNERALGFYRTLGFDVTGQGEPRFERDGAWFETIHIARTVTTADR